VYIHVLLHTFLAMCSFTTEIHLVNVHSNVVESSLCSRTDKCL